jgi:hypothetical protein
MTTLFPSSNGIIADQLFVPVAMPEFPFEVDQLTEVTPTLSDAVPEMVIEEE